MVSEHLAVSCLSWSASPMPSLSAVGKLRCYGLGQFKPFLSPQGLAYGETHQDRKAPLAQDLKHRPSEESNPGARGILFSDKWLMKTFLS